MSLHQPRIRMTATERSGRRAFLFVLAALVLTAGLWATPLRAEEAKVVYHADFSDPRRVSAMLTSINNMVTYYADSLIDYDVRIVFVAHGIRFVTDDRLEGTPFAEDVELAERRDNLKGRLTSLYAVHGVKLELCDITRSQIGLDGGKLFEGVDLVPSGVVRIAELQRQGFAYLKIE